MIRGSRSYGFTLLELLIAITIFALLGLASYRMLDSVLRSDERIRSQERELRELTRAFAGFEHDLLQAVSRPVRDSQGELRPALLGESQAQEGGLALELTRSGWRNPAGWKRSTLARVRWRFDGRTLERHYWRVLDQASGSEPQVQRVLEQVSNVRLRYLDQTDEWRQDWPPATGLTREQALELLPRAVELRLVHPRFGELRRLLRLPDGPALEQPAGKVLR